MVQAYRYFTTPIYYASGNPHAGHLYATLLLNVMKRHYADRGMNTLSLTGMDEHGEKIEQKAIAAGKSPQEFVDSFVPVWQGAFDTFGLTSDVFMRTTSTEHVKNVQEILKRCHENGDIYYGEYEGSYCKECEAFLSPGEMGEDKSCLIHKIPTELRKEGNYYFRTTKYRAQLKELIASKRITHQDRFVNELLSMLNTLDSDLSISRPKTRTTWGVELPFDPSHVAYVWFDALPNYVTGIGGVKEALSNPYWASCTHIIGKDILKFHGIYWPAMCLSLGIPVAKLMVTGWLVVGGHKMSKSLGNVVSPDDLKPYGIDAFTNSVLRLNNVGEDLELTLQVMMERYNADLANGIGNLLSRTLGMVEKYNDRKLPAFQKQALTPEEWALSAQAEKLPAQVAQAFDDYRLADALNAIWSLIRAADKYIAEKKPWVLAKDESREGREKLLNVLAMSVGVLRTVGYVAAAFFPEKMRELLGALGEKYESGAAPATQSLVNYFDTASRFFEIQVGFTFQEIPKLYARLEVAEEMAKLTTSPAEKNAPEKKGDGSTKQAGGGGRTAPVEGMAVIGIDDFARVDMRVGVVVNAELVEGSDKLLRLTVSLGELGARQIFAGIRQWVKPEEIVNHKVIVVANLAPRKMKFGLSEGMMLAADTQDGGLSPVYLPESLKEGARLS